ncbi:MULTISPECIES: acyl-CoA dehydrogenase family protein [unclassified Rhodococcus (in: high G+C Gram-positive bacteria)]|uniref:acyl-CoA dehydrogenase family protein n=1 Tax=unclassified Rhodococcus (in: high G+C Gram-positive bacteria) TaxID=192944 RepID=UPI000926D6C5|nr:acyl-CoA dehydrogenase family protein [Rhodococcus sp. M8]OLL19320.1 acyl-CoA dehydrogenase [Rhodococcus sp. M8]QPG43149.1 acyl-CoA/acyl-ACP dehydrogenase [Rhodococcus sp. M8]
MILGTSAAAEDTALLTDTIRSVIRRTDPVDGRAERVYRDGPVDRDLWAVLGTEIGVGALAVPEAAGGLGASFADVAAVLELLGAELSRVPVLSGVVAAAALSRCDGAPRAAELLAGIATGETVVATVVTAPGTDPGFRAEHVGDDVFVTGRAGFVVDGDVADTVLMPAADESGKVGLYAVDAAVLTTERMDTTDATRILSRVRAEAAPATVLAERAPLGWIHDRAVVALACESLGVARTCLANAVDYAGRRVQFGRVIGGFQAIKHMLAEVSVAVELAESAVAHAVWAVVEGSDDDLAEAAAIAALACGDAARLAVEKNVQVHGGIGFTWEHTAHLYYRRALTSGVLWGSGDDHAQRLYALAAAGAATSSEASTDPRQEPASAVLSSTES